MAADNNILKLAENLSGKITESEEYLNYKKYSEELEKQPDLYAMVNDHRRQHFMLQNNQNGRVSYEEYNNFTAKSEELRRSELVSNFLDAEVGLAKLIQDVMRAVMSKVDFGTDFLD